MPPTSDTRQLHYPALGLTRLRAVAAPDATAWPAGFGHVDTQIRVGTGEAAFRSLSEGIMSWQVQRLAGLRVSGPPRATVGARVSSGFGVGDLRLPVPCEVVWTEQETMLSRADGDQVRVTGFGYGTLPGHPALGEEAFLALQTPDGGVYFRLLAFSRPAGFLFRLGAPVTRLTQRSVTGSYLRAARLLAMDS